MNLDAYLARIDYQGPVAPTLACLTEIHRQHLLTIPYEDLDVQLGRKITLDIEQTFEKIVVRRRGGWCYEMNGLLGWALKEIGFDVTRLLGGMLRSHDGDEAMGNHLILRVDLDGTIIADTGMGNGVLEPMLLEEGRGVQGDRQFRFEALEDGYWRFHNHPGTSPADFDFLPTHNADEDLLAIHELHRLADGQPLDNVEEGHIAQATCGDGGGGGGAHGASPDDRYPGALHDAMWRMGHT